MPWVKEWAEKTLSWTINLLGDAYEKLKEIWDWLTGIPEKLGLVKKESEKVGKAMEEMVPPETKEDLIFLEKVLENIISSLKEADEKWKSSTQVVKRQIASQIAQVMLMEKGVENLAGRLPLTFAKKWERGFLAQTPNIQKAILEAVISGDTERALSMGGEDAINAFIWGASPGGVVPTLKEGQKDVKEAAEELFSPLESEAIKTAEELTKQMDKMMKGILGGLKPMAKEMRDAADAMWEMIPEGLQEKLQPIRNMMLMLLDSLLLLFKDFGKKVGEEIEDSTYDWNQIWEDSIRGRLESEQAGADKMKGIWEKFWENLKKGIEKITITSEDVVKDIVSGFSAAFTSILTGAESIDEAMRALAATIRETLIKALVDVAMQAAVMGKAILAGIALIAAAIVSLAKQSRETVYQSSEAFLDAIRGMEDRIARFGGEMFAGMVMVATEIAVEFKKMGMSFSKTLDEMEQKLKDFNQQRIDLEGDTREKLISELDKYYDYRELRVMSLDELMALSAKTRVKIEEGSIEEVEESEEEQERRRKDREIDRLKRIEDTYKKEDELLRRKIALMEIEIKLLEYKIEVEANGHSARAKQLSEELKLMMENYKKSVKEFEDAEKKKQKATEETTKVFEDSEKKKQEATERTEEEFEVAMREMRNYMGSSTSGMVRNWNSSLDEMKEKMGELPTIINFDVIGHLDMPDIPDVPTQWFDIFGRYQAPEVPSYQEGILSVPRTTLAWVHEGEGIFPREVMDWLRKAFGHSAIFGQGGPASSGGITVNVPRGAVVIYGDIRTKADVEELKEELGHDLGEQIAKQLLRTVPL